MNNSVSAEPVLRATLQQTFEVKGKEAIRTFATWIGDTNPIHHDDDAARRAGYKEIIAPGVMVIGFISSAIATMYPGIRVRKLEVEFLNPLYAGSFPTVFCTIVHRRSSLMKMEVAVENGDQEIARGSCMLVLP